MNRGFFDKNYDHPPAVPQHWHRDPPKLRQARAPRRESRDTCPRNRAQLRQPPRPRARHHLHPRGGGWKLHHVCQVNVGVKFVVKNIPGWAIGSFTKRRSEIYCKK